MLSVSIRIGLHLSLTSCHILPSPLPLRFLLGRCHISIPPAVVLSFRHTVGFALHTCRDCVLSGLCQCRLASWDITIPPVTASTRIGMGESISTNILLVETKTSLGKDRPSGESTRGYQDVPCLAARISHGSLLCLLLLQARLSVVTPHLLL